MQQTSKKKNKTSYMERLDDIIQVNYLPTDMDIIRSRYRTSGVLTMEFIYNKKIFQ